MAVGFVRNSLSFYVIVIFMPWEARRAALLTAVVRAHVRRKVGEVGRKKEGSQKIMKNQKSEEEDWLGDHPVTVDPVHHLFVLSTDVFVPSSTVVSSATPRQDTIVGALGLSPELTG